MIQNDARTGRSTWTSDVADDHPTNPPKGWTGPKIVDGKPVEGTWRAHQVPVTKFLSLTLTT